MKSVFKFILFPLSLIFGTGVWLRNRLYDYGVLSSKSFDFPVLAVGNLSTGGSGKTPHVDLLARSLKNKYKLAVLSRGYGRKSKGYVQANKNMTSAEVGDEPLQTLSNHPELLVAVDESRVKGISTIKQSLPDLDAVILDDAFQHRKIKASLNILLIECAYFNGFHPLLPAGRQREPFSARKRADVIVVSKCPNNLSSDKKNKIEKTINYQKHQHLFFSTITYTKCLSLFDNNEITAKGLNILLITGIAKAHDLLQHISNANKTVKHMEFSDHHEFTLAEVNKIKDEFDASSAKYDIILTTEKDAIRLKREEFRTVLGELPIFYQTIRAQILFDKEEQFNQFIDEHIQQYK